MLRTVSPAPILDEDLVIKDVALAFEVQVALAIVGRVSRTGRGPAVRAAPVLDEDLVIENVAFAVVVQVALAQI